MSQRGKMTERELDRVKTFLRCGCRSICDDGRINSTMSAL